jgi:hypothetical protein
MASAQIKKQKTKQNKTKQTNKQTKSFELGTHNSSYIQIMQNICKNGRPMTWIKKTRF